MPISFLAFATSTGHPPTIFLVIGFLIGIVLFFLGFRTYREYRVIADTPLAPVRSIPMGLVHVHGNATGEDRLTSPLTGMPCYYFRVQIEHWVKKEKEGEWQTLRTDTAERNFYLDDGTGKVVVNPHSAEYDVTRTFHAEIGPESSRSRHVDPSLGVPGPLEQDLRAYVMGDVSRAGAALAAMNVPGAAAIGKVLAVEQTLESVGMSFGAGPSYRFTEHCLLADRECNVLGTCVENSSPKDEHDRNLIMKGVNERTFLVTSKSERQIEKTLGWKAFILILLGAALMIGTTAVALHSRGLL